MNRKGFTLLEVVIAGVLISSIALVVYQTLLFSDTFERREVRLRQDQLLLHAAAGRMAQDLQESQADYIRIVTLPARGVPSSEPNQPVVIVPSARRVQPVVEDGVVTQPPGEFLVNSAFGPDWSSLLIFTRVWDENRGSFVLYRAVVGNEVDDPPPALYFDAATNVQPLCRRESDQVIVIPWTGMPPEKRVDLTDGEALLDRSSQFIFELPPRSRVALVELFTPLTSTQTRVQIRNGGQITRGDATAL
ncbi:MAG TPA: prepilin-type N-terminal cleavage/methylation domain-containing protein, partial [Planctomycetota bacterium]